MMDHAHHFDLESPNGPTSEGVCRVCGERRVMPNATENSNWRQNGKGIHASMGARLPQPNLPSQPTSKPRPSRARPRRTNSIGVPEAAEALNMNALKMRRLCVAGRIIGAMKVGNQWTIPTPPRIKA